MPFSQTESWVPVGYARFASLSSAITLGTSTPSAGTIYTSLQDGLGNKVVPNHAIISVETQPVRIRDDGTAPTTTEGELFKADSKIIIEASPDAIRTTKIIETAASASVRVRYYI